MKSMSHKTAKGVAAISLAMLMALPALTGCSMDKPDAGNAQEETTQTQTAIDTAQSKTNADAKSKSSSSTKKKAAVKQSGGTVSSKKSAKKSTVSQKSAQSSNQTTSSQKAASTPSTNKK
ncbi:hypothetical protein [uncultured Agathobaculum sp.]|uniref:hypothetical protein n=1 Tax=uncultured Agathobaculum sp. TaxID=2048140 RepID=UPI00320AEF91